MCCPNEVCMSSRVRALRDAERSRVKRMPPHDPDVEFDAQMICDDCGKATHIDDERVSGAQRRPRRRVPATCLKRLGTSLN